MKLIKTALSIALTITLMNCADLAQVAGQTAQTLSSSTPSQVKTLADALQAATLATQAVDLYVNTANPSRATLLELQALNEGLHSALVQLQAANAANQSLALAVFNAALTAFNAYATVTGVKH